ncbi:restriction endonuclease subunit M [Furfurilactobacillus sp. WILCCON 0119]
MDKTQPLVQTISGSPQFRIEETLDKTAPLYFYYGQAELENDLIGIDLTPSDAKQIRTANTVKTVHSGDAIFSLISGRASIARKKHQDYLLTQNYIKLKPSKKLDAKYLTYLLNEDNSIKHQFQDSMQGSIIFKYTVKQIKELRFTNLPTLKVQELIGEVYFNYLHLQAIRKRRITIENAAMLEILKGVKNDERIDE